MKTKVISVIVSVTQKPPLGGLESKACKEVKDTKDEELNQINDNLMENTIDQEDVTQMDQD